MPTDITSFIVTIQMPKFPLQRMFAPSFHGIPGLLLKLLFHGFWIITIVLHYEIPSIIGALDYISINHYFCGYISINPQDWGQFNGAFLPLYTLGQKFLATSDFGWGLNPASLAGTCQWINDQFNPNHLPILVTEHGIADASDTKRQWFLKESLTHLSILVNRGLNVTGYIHWSLLDNYEWAEGRKMKFGLYQTNYETQERIPRESAKIYSRIIAKNSR